MIQLILHLIGDYVTQSDWMANNKTKCSKAAAAHAIVYSLPFLMLQPSWTAFAVILVTHFLIDRFRIARFVVFAKNVLGNPDSHRFGWPSRMVLSALENLEENQALKALGFNVDDSVKEHHRKHCWANCSGTGYPTDTPPFLAVWLLIAADNTLHLAINYAALRWL